MNSAKGLITIPDEILLKIFAELCFTDLLQCRSVSKSWFDVINKDTTTMDRIKLSLTAQTIQQAVPNLAVRCNYSRLSLIGIELKSFNDNFPLTLLQLVKHLHLVDCKFQLNTEQLDVFKQYLTNLKYLELFIGSATALECIIANLSEFENLTHLSVILRPDYKKDFPLQLRNLENFESFSIKYLEKPFQTQARCNELKLQTNDRRLENLKYFSVSFLRVKAVTLKQIFRYMPNLEELELAHTCKVTDFAALTKNDGADETISNLTRLQILSIDDVSVDNDWFLATMNPRALSTIKFVEAADCWLSAFRSENIKSKTLEVLKKNHPNVNIDFYE